MWTIDGPYFVSDTGKVMILVVYLYSLKSFRASFRSFPGKTLYDIGYVALTSDPYLWMRPAMEDDSFQY